MKILNFLGQALKPATEIFKDHGKKVSSKRVFALGGGGTLIGAGITFLNQAVEVACEKAYAPNLIAGSVCIVCGCLVAVLLSEKIKNIQVNDPK